MADPFTDEDRVERCPKCNGVENPTFPPEQRCACETAPFTDEDRADLREQVADRAFDHDTADRITRALARIDHLEKALRRIEKKHVLEPQAARIARAALEGEDE